MAKQSFNLTTALDNNHVKITTTRQLFARVNFSLGKITHKRETYSNTRVPSTCECQNSSTRERMRAGIFPPISERMRA